MSALLWSLLRSLQPLACFLLLCCLFARLVLGVSGSYVMECCYLEMRLKLQRFWIERAADKDSSSVTKHAHAKKSKDTKPPTLRGVQVVPTVTYTAKGQTLPPSKKVSELFSSENLPQGEVLSYLANAKSPQHFGRAPREEAALGLQEDEAWVHRVKCLREGAEVHREVRQNVQLKVKPGMALTEIVEMVEKASSCVVGFDPKQPLKRGWAFPTGLSLNEVAAHDTVNPGDPCRWLEPTDIAKLDFGVQVEGHILDCAFTFTFDSMHDELMQAVQEATNEGIKQAGPDALVSEVGRNIKEVMESAEVHRPNGKVLPVRAIRNLTGHSIGPYKIHNGKSLPSVNTGGRTRMLVGELWAVETFGSSGGLGYVSNLENCSHFMRHSGAAPNAMQRSILSSNARELLELIDRRFGTLAFCPRWITQEAVRCKSPLLKGSGNDQRWWAGCLDELCNTGVVNRYPPLADLPGSHTAQYEHTILLGAAGKEVLTRGADY